MASPTGLQQLHFVLIPLMCPGHLIPMVDMVQAPAIINRDIQSGLPIRILKRRFPCVEAGLPEGCENMDALPSPKLSKNFFDAARVVAAANREVLGRDKSSPELHYF
ncbi:hypothetical protein Patl1_32265 [Pistacia atlantica]|uniref:Uncharacterized protein n=1 Tax=Pistacia atlantica TaxID=434234 RepID=A0ACC1AMU8_9ROSI|nr:hypothetical protein Patl1_32265 [Pistacia atlantica]